VWFIQPFQKPFHDKASTQNFLQFKTNLSSCLFFVQQASDYKRLADCRLVCLPTCLLADFTYGLHLSVGRCGSVNNVLLTRSGAVKPAASTGCLSSSNRFFPKNGNKIQNKQPK